MKTSEYMFYGETLGKLQRIDFVLLPYCLAMLLLWVKKKTQKKTNKRLETKSKL